MPDWRWRKPMCAGREIGIDDLPDGGQWYETRLLTGEYFPLEIEKWDEALALIKKLKEMYPTTVQLWYMWKQDGDICEEQIY